jgi:chloramphenicol-sensitive protein RarD
VPATSQRAGIGYGLLAYVIWGCFPIYFRQLADISPMDILSNRTAWAFVFVTVLLTLRRRWRSVTAMFATPRHLVRLSIAALLLGSNWLGFLWALDQHQVVAASLGYFLTPLVNVLLGLIVLKEKLNRLEWLAIGLAGVAVGNELVALGTVPWISLFLAATFGTYGLLRKQVPVDAVSGLWLETLAMLPICIGYAVWQAQSGHLVFGLFSGWSAALLIGSGVMTALPLMAFAAATQRLDLATVGMLMYINPTMQFLTAIFLFDEPLQPARLVSFALIWLGLLVFSISMWSKLKSKHSMVNPENPNKLKS